MFLEAQLLYNQIDATESLTHNVTFSFVDNCCLFCQLEFNTEAIADGYMSENSRYRCGFGILNDFREYEAELFWFFGTCFIYEHLVVLALNHSILPPPPPPPVPSSLKFVSLLSSFTFVSTLITDSEKERALKTLVRLLQAQPPLTGLIVSIIVILHTSYRGKCSVMGLIYFSGKQPWSTSPHNQDPPRPTSTTHRHTHKPTHTHT